MRKYLLLTVFIGISILNISGYLLQAGRGDGEGEAGCPSLQNSAGTATCGSPGSDSGCVIACTNGATVYCKRPEDD